MTNILVIDDEQIMRDGCSRILSRDGWSVICAENGAQGLDEMKGNPDKIDVILLDLMMPEMDGFTFMQELRRRPDCARVPVIVITAKDLTGEERRRLNGEVARILGKDTTEREQLVAEVRQLLTQQLEFHI